MTPQISSEKYGEKLRWKRAERHCSSERAKESAVKREPLGREMKVLRRKTECVLDGTVR